MKSIHYFTGFLLLLCGILTGIVLSIRHTTPQMADYQDLNQVVNIPETGHEFAINNVYKSADEIAHSENAVIRLFEVAAPSVVYITTTSASKTYWSTDITEIPKGSGTGFMWDNYGHIVTNYHVIEGGNRFTVTLSDQTSFDAEFIGAAPGKDLAVLRIDAPASRLKPIPLARSSRLKVGQFAYAIGNPFGFDQSLTTGVISALGREITATNGRKIYDVIQTDAAINPGNSGGPLLNSQGQLIGVNTAIFSPSGAYSGIGFSIPSDVVNLVVPDLIQYGQINRPIMGVELLPDAYVQAEGAMISNVMPGSPAEKTGLRGVTRSRNGGFKYGDLITKIDGVRIKDNNDLIETLEKYSPDDRVTITFKREGKVYEAELRLASSID